MHNNNACLVPTANASLRCKFKCLVANDVRGSTQRSLGNTSAYTQINKSIYLYTILNIYVYIYIYYIHASISAPKVSWHQSAQSMHLFVLLWLSFTVPLLLLAALMDQRPTKYRNIQQPNAHQQRVGTLHTHFLLSNAGAVLPKLCSFPALTFILLLSVPFSGNNFYWNARKSKW